ncbi:EAL domain-containing protein [Sulfuricurvum sp.]|uniref:putative bifunctional diguanylate cyclase/phosphodiesterase n=1 Tax=Sulfuricurvum sp. TaxID=2025608 RepID=UPI002627030F|nr:EAL domain-containing protein [Sulfuricurvum sp.]MDD2781315.1 EAL domain-containing protein [Sulfuricurvum sp.]
MNTKSLKNALSISAIYLIFGLAWIYFSDAAVASFANDNTQLTLLQTYKGWFFIFFTTVMLFFVSYQFFSKELLAYLRHLEEQHQVQQQLAKKDTLLNSLIDSSPDAIVIKGLDRRYIVYNHGAAEFSGVESIFAIGKTANDIFPPETANIINTIDNNLLEQKTVSDHEEIMQMPNGNVYTYWVKKGLLRTDDGNLFGIYGIYRNITEEREYELNILTEKERFERLAHHDPLTELPNKLSLTEYTSNRIVTQNNHPFSLLFLDLDGFQQINDSYGHLFGDKLLIEVAHLLQHIFYPDGYIVRTGGDEFVIIVSPPEDELSLSSLINRLIENFTLPIHIDGIDIYTTLSIGAANYPQDATTIEGLLQCADAAMYEAKKNGKNTYRFYNPTFTQKALERTIITNKLKSALRDDQLSVFYQPQVDAQSEKIIGYEALIRWESDDGFIPPSLFIPISEESGMILKIGEFVLIEGCKTAHRWSQEGLLHGHIAINVSAYQLIHPNFILQLDNIIHTTGCNPSCIELEITESSILENPEKTITLLSIIKSKGFKISIDDFGTGYSSLSYLKNLPIDKLKIDISFVRNITNEPKNQTIVKTIISLAKGLGMEVLAEGVETLEEFNFLRENGIDTIQGFYFYKPMPSTSIEALLHASRKE